MVSDVVEKTAAAAAKSLQSCPTLCDPMDGSPPGSPVPGILQARTATFFQRQGRFAWLETETIAPVPFGGKVCR